jgi:hypothetical protein
VDGVRIYLSRLSIITKGMPVLRYGVQFLALLHKYVLESTASKPLNAFIAGIKVEPRSGGPVGSKAIQDSVMTS